MLRDVDPFHAWDNLPVGFTRCPDCGLPVGNPKRHRASRACAGIAVIVDAWRRGYVMIARSVPAPHSFSGADCGQALPAIAAKRRFARSTVAGAALFDVLLLASVSSRNGLTALGNPHAAAVRDAIATIQAHGRPDLADQPGLTGFDVYCSPVRVGEFGGIAPRDPRDEHLHSITRAGDRLALDDHLSGDAGTFLTRLMGASSDCLLLQAWWADPDPRMHAPVPWRAVWEQVARYQQWRERDVPPWVLDAWMAVGAGPAQADAWTKSGYTPWEAYLASMFHVYPDAPDGSPYGQPQQWREHGFDVLEAQKWSGVGNNAVRPLFDDRGYWHASGHKEVPFTPAEAGQHAAAGRSHTAAVADRDAGGRRARRRYPTAEEDLVWAWRNQFWNRQDAAMKNAGTKRARP